jgi:hypothetical protein
MRLSLVLLLLSQTCHIVDGLPDPHCTPGEATTATLDEICHRKTKAFRHVTDATKRQVLELYGTPDGEVVEVDHLIPIELGGANSLINLWPQPEKPYPGYKDKDRMENRLHKLVCAGKMPLAEAQKEIARDWQALYYRLFPSLP